MTTTKQSLLTLDSLNNILRASIKDQLVAQLKSSVTSDVTAFHTTVIASILHNFEFLINNLIEFFTLNGILNSFFSLKLIHLKSSFKKFNDQLISGTADLDSQSSSTGNKTKKIKLDLKSLDDQKFQDTNMKLVKLLQAFQAVLAEIVATFNNVNLKAYLLSQLSYRTLISASHFNAGAASKTINEQNQNTIDINTRAYVSSIFKAKFFSENLSNIQGLIFSLQQLNNIVSNGDQQQQDSQLLGQFEKIAAVDNALVQFNIVNSIAFYQFKESRKQNQQASDNNFFNASVDLKILNDNSAEFGKFVQQKNHTLKTLHNRGLFG